MDNKKESQFHLMLVIQHFHNEPNLWEKASENVLPVLPEHIIPDQTRPGEKLGSYYTKSGLIKSLLIDFAVVVLVCRF